MPNLVKHNFVGSAADYWIPDDIHIEIDIVPASMIGWVRSGVPNLPSVTHSTWHDTGNSGADARHERSYLHGGPRNNNGTKRKVGYNFVADGVPRVIDGKRYRGSIIQLTPLDEVTWAAGMALGNTISWHIEQCFGGANVWANAVYVSASLHGAIHAAQGWDVRSRLVQHHHWTKKECPGQIRARKEWDQVVSMVEAAKTLAVRAANGIPEPAPEPEPVWPYPDPDPIPALAGNPESVVLPNGAVIVRLTAQVEVIRDTARRLHADPNAEVVGPMLRTGQRFSVSNLIINPDKSLWLKTPGDTRVRFEDVKIVAA